MEEHEEYEVGFGLEVEHVLNDEDEVVEGHEADDSDEVGIDELATTDLSVRHQSISLYLNV